MCADSSGISMAFTQQFLGDRAQQKQMALMKQGGYNQTYFSCPTALPATLRTRSATLVNSTARSPPPTPGRCSADNDRILSFHF
ncbi:YcgJ family protein [Candidatus Contendibacter odensensis]|uniref:YcgJ family protein n=1 Tax=Candidatus Contendibacter odensensis TaxID=1400860 RepID=UPI003B969C90